MLFWSITGFARSNGYPAKLSFQNILANQDIVLGEVHDIIQDQDGFMWFAGASGLLRYDGYEFKAIQFPTKNENEPVRPLKFVNALVEDNGGNIWISASSSIFIYNKQTNKLLDIGNSHKDTKSALTSHIEVMTLLPDGNIAAGSDNSFFVIDANSYEFVVYSATDEGINGLSNSNVHTIIVEGDIVWIGTDGGLEAFNWKTKEFELFKPAANKPDSVGDNSTHGIVPIGEGKYWIGTTNGLVKYDTNTRSAKRYQNDPNDANSLSGNVIWDIFLDSSDNLWVLTDGAGISIYNAEKDNFTQYAHSSGDPTSLSSNQIRTLAEDQNGDFWIGHYPDGISFFDLSSTGITTYHANENDPKALNHKSILSIQEDRAGGIWLGTDGGGLNFFDKNTGHFSHFKHDPNNDNTISSNAVLTAFIDSEDELWLGTWAGGVSKYNKETKDFTRLPFDYNRAHTEKTATSTKLGSGNVWCIYEDRQKTLWICTHSAGISKYDRKTKEFTAYTPDDDDTNSVPSFLVWTVLEDSKGRFWVGTVNGLAIMDRKKENFIRYTEDDNDPNSLSHPSIISIYEDSKGRVWFGTDNGLNLYNESDDNFTVYSTKDGFNDATIRGISEDPQGNLWLGSSNGLIRFNPETKEVKNYNRVSGKLVGGFNYNAAYTSSTGQLYFGGVNGLRIINTDQLAGNKRPPPIVLTDFRIFSDSVPINGPDKILTKSINSTNKIILDHTKSMFVIHFSALNYRDSEKNRFQYKLDGFDDHWIIAGNQRSAKYTNLDAGTYTFQVKGSNNDGVWNEDGKQVVIVQLPPPWKTWWAYTLYALTFLSLIAYFIHHQRRKRKIVEEQNRILELKVAERTKELRHKNEDIQSMLSNIHQGLFTIEENGYIHPEYSDFLESIFETSDIANAHIMDLLFKNTNINSDSLWQVRESLSTMPGEHECNFDFNKHLLPRELDVIINGKIKHLSLDWDPIIVDHYITKLMVAVRDITRIKEMEDEAKNKERELEIISHLLNISDRRYNDFEVSAAKFIDECGEVIEKSAVCDNETVSLLFRNMHTIKGNARTHGFKFISALAHDMETKLANIRDQESPRWDQDSLLAELSTVEAVIQEYNNVYHNILGRSDQESYRQGDGGVWIEDTHIQRILNATQPSQTSSVQRIFDTAKSQSLKGTLSDILVSLSSIAHQLGKPEPTVNVDAPGLRVKNDAESLFNNVFSHLLRNALDHGIEGPDERKEANKSPQGNINIYAIKSSSHVEIHLKDDGKGINISKLFKRGVDQGFWHPREKPESDEIAQYIFESGVSTKDVVSNISGRGVGMDAVKRFLQDNDGDIHIQLADPNQQNADYHQFQLVIQLPFSLFYFDDEIQKTIKLEGR